MSFDRTPERRKPEQVAWSAITILAAKTNERLGLDRQFAIDEQQLMLLERCRDILRAAPQPPEDLLAWIDHTLKHPRPTMQWDVLETVAHQLSPYVSVGEVNYRAPNGTENVDMANINLASRRLEQVPTREILTFADSHTATAYTLRAAERMGWNLNQTAVLSFDRHADYLPDDPNAVVKATVISDILQHTRIPAAAVVGEYYHGDGAKERTDGKRIDFLPGEAVIKRRQPDHQVFSTWLDQLFTEWQEQGITSIYTTVDLDALRLYQQGYTATDYNPMGMISKLLVNHTLENMLASEDSKNPEALLRRMQFALDTRELSGIPASFVGRALDLAKQKGLTIGVQGGRGRKKLIGDVVEYTVPDNEQRTAKIAKALLHRLASAAQH
jgi:arginase family enzyme